LTWPVGARGVHRECAPVIQRAAPGPARARRPGAPAAACQDTKLCWDADPAQCDYQPVAALSESPTIREVLPRRMARLAGTSMRARSCAVRAAGLGAERPAAAGLWLAGETQSIGAAASAGFGKYTVIKFSGEGG